VFNPKKTVLESFIELGTLNRKTTFSLLSKFLFSWNDLDKRIAALSGGEMNRLQLARIDAVKAKFLVLDEPTNHLDIASREASEEALEEFDGTLLLVSHDRYLLDKIADKVVEIREGKLEVFSGNFSEFWRSRRPRSKTLAARRKTATRVARKPARTGREKTTVSGDSSGHLESRIENMEAERKMLESEIAKAFETGNHQLGAEKSRKLSTLSRRIEKLYKEWEKGA
jgi:ATP-binding cassette subfamily F protein 3